MAARNMRNECYTCSKKYNIPGECHIGCIDPDRSMTGDSHGISKGWFIYPFLFDPVWKQKLCANYNEKPSA